MSGEDRRYLALALSLGERATGRCWPNPAVGCVIVRDGRIVGRGATASGGRPHAETQALAMAGAQARGATAYVSLEPCAHQGATPPCADALIAAGIARVVTPLQDPDPRVAGRGHARLHAAGVVVATGLLADEARLAHRGFFMRVTQARPWLTLKLGLSLDGRIATASGESRWITGPQARRHGHALRLRHDAVLIGAGTARADDPLLTIRDLGGVAQPVRIVAARHLDLPPTGALALTAATVPLWLLHGPGVDGAAWEARGARLIEVAPGEGGLDPAAMLKALGSAGLTSVLCEGGGRLAAALLKSGQVDEIVAISAGLVIGAEGVPGIGPLRLAALADAPRYKLAEVDPLGGDALHLWRRG